jgi:23S rRNA (guanosine2251-2'-O)-methyltransferase
MKRVIAGPRAVVEALQSDASGVAVVYVASDKANRTPLKEICQQAQRVRVRYEERERVDLDQMADGQRHQGVLAIAGEYVYADLEALVPTDKPYPLLVALDQITDPHNFGAIVRSAVAFGADGIVILKDRSASVTASVVRASAGATEYARIARVTNLVRALQQLSQRGLQIVGLDGSASEQLDALTFPLSGRVLVVGSEGKGLRRLVREYCDNLARIELSGPIASLNASVAAAIALYQSGRQRHGGVE